MQYIDELGSPATYNHYPVGWAWAFNTPFKMWKRYNFEGGVADPMIVAWPNGIEARGELRHQFLHATDIVPTVYDCLGVELPETVEGYQQLPLEGLSFRSTFESDDVPTAGTRAGKRFRCIRRSPAGESTSTIAGSSTTRRPTRPRATTSPRSTPRSCRS